MKLNEYQQQAMKFAKYESSDYPFLALGEEAGEVLGKIAKASRKWAMSANGVLENTCVPNEFLNETQLKLKQGLIKELGDVLWQLSACANELGVPLSDIAQVNLNKLSGRDERGTIIGAGDDR